MTFDENTWKDSRDTAEEQDSEDESTTSNLQAEAYSPLVKPADPIIEPPTKPDVNREDESKGEKVDTVKKDADSIIKMIKDGKISKDEASSIGSLLLQNYKSGDLDRLQNTINRQLKEAGSPYRFNIDSSMAGIQDIGYIGANIVDRKTGKVVDHCGTAVNNSPQIDRGREDFPIRRYPDKVPPKEEYPQELDIPRLDIPSLGRGKR